MRKLKRSNNNRIIAGVCGGIGEFFNIDPTIIRIAWLLFALPSFGTFFFVYLLCIFVIPEDNGVIYNESNVKTKDNSPLFFGGALIIFGSYLLGRVFYPMLHMRIRGLTKYWPVLLIVLGIYILINQNNNKTK